MIERVSTIGVAIAIPQPYATQLQRYRASFGDPQASTIPTHITLVPPTEVKGDVERVRVHLAEVARRHTSFHLRLRGTATFRPISPVVFVNVTEGISACEMLSEDSRQGPLSQELAFPFHPHVTVAHHLDEAALDVAYETLADYDAAFEVDSFHLYLHGDDGLWRADADYVLAPAAAGVRSDGGYSDPG
jgi:2'-5' RNA ligase